MPTAWIRDDCFFIDFPNCSLSYQTNYSILVLIPVSGIPHARPSLALLPIWRYAVPFWISYLPGFTSHKRESEILWQWRTFFSHAIDASVGMILIFLLKLPELSISYRVASRSSVLIPFSNTSHDGLDIVIWALGTSATHQ